VSGCGCAVVGLWFVQEKLGVEYAHCQQELQQEKEKRLSLLQEVAEMRTHIVQVAEREKVVLELRKSLKSSKRDLESSNAKLRVGGYVCQVYYVISLLFLNVETIAIALVLLSSENRGPI
jgi:hypothetical protein